MDRRRYLRTVAVVAGTLVAGCSGGDPVGAGTETATPIPTGADSDARPTEGPTPVATPRTGAIPESPVADSVTNWERRDPDGTTMAADDPPRIAFASEADRLFVRGKALVGSSSCNEAGVHEVAYDDGELRLSVAPAWKDSGHKETPRACTADMSADDYEVEVTFDDGLPERVVAEEHDARAEVRRAVYER